MGPRGAGWRGYKWGTRDYEGNLVERVGKINADLVIGAWLQEGVAEVTDLISPRLHFKRGSDQG